VQGFVVTAPIQSFTVPACFTVSQNGSAASATEEVIQVTANDIEENKIFDEESARQFTQPGTRLPVHSFADPKLPNDSRECPPPKYLSN